MKSRIIKSILLVLSVVCILCCQIPAVYADTDGTEMQVIQPEQLEIQLGTSWAGVEFQLKTDAGIYPGVITVGEDGILKLEIGGSSSYILSCTGSSVAVPAPDAEPEVIPNADENVEIIDEPDASDDIEDPSDSAIDESEDLENTEEPNGATVAGIPVLHIALFGGGLLLAVAALLVIRFTGKKRALDAEYEDDDDD